MWDATVPESLASTRILMVDPDSDTRVRHARMLQPVTPDIEEADDGAEALGRPLVRPLELSGRAKRLATARRFSAAIGHASSVSSPDISTHLQFKITTARPNEPARGSWG